MGLKIIVDGYNFIGSHQGLRGDIKGRREELIQRLARYRVLKRYSVTVVFDGLRSGWSDEHGEVREGVQVVFSRHGESADQVISRMAWELGSASVVVSSDREVAKAVQQAGGVTVRTSEFERKLKEALHPGSLPSHDDLDRPLSYSHKKGNPRRLSREERKKQQRLMKL